MKNIKKEDYKYSLSVIGEYEKNLEEELDKTAEAFRLSLVAYFHEKKLEGFREVEKVSLRKEKIRREDMSLEFYFTIYVDLVDDFIDEDYDGGDNDFIERLALGYSINARMCSGYYGK